MIWQNLASIPDKNSKQTRKKNFNQLKSIFEKSYRQYYVLWLKPECFLH